MEFKEKTSQSKRHYIIIVLFLFWKKNTEQKQFSADAIIMEKVLHESMEEATEGSSISCLLQLQQISVNLVP